ncbi:adenosylcobinamide-phosphate synthase CbiB [Crocosphaera sp. UHCC 0190]|uniref:adenosylcobinamide-phosphate synthase CbiB n=1 Tax=Crocosphaera sp. UHCC 0190 TaxID=3110246 RepID=UPI002B21170A|nr:adenosylcobinamide-phosphate synthase CbiB [Crocosphaera sp. UHCC 0190]MEA5509221.1 adenosylcobinamide-phosphate synthase CbiB [Crocosphaera sp. UHCC 0190]
MDTNVTVIVLGLAAIIDYLIADPWGWLHPVQVMGWVISRYCNFLLSICQGKGQRRWAGVGLGLGLILSSGIFGWAVSLIKIYLHPFFGIAIEAILLGSCFAGRGLRLAAEDVLTPLTRGNIELARTKLSQYVGRDTENLSETEILRSVLETVSENATDGVMAPLFYAIAGAFFPGVGSVSLALAYKAASTLDSMVGYQKEPFTDIGWFSAKCEDILTWFPCRLTVLTLAILSGKPRSVLALCRRDAPQDPSPNSGWSECVYAAILGVQVGGINTYQGIIKPKPLLGNPLHSITPQTIDDALNLTRRCCLLWLGLGIVGLMGVSSSGLLRLVS